MVPIPNDLKSGTKGSNFYVSNGPKRGNRCPEGKTSDFGMEATVSCETREECVYPYDEELRKIEIRRRTQEQVVSPPIVYQYV